MSPGDARAEGAGTKGRALTSVGSRKKAKARGHRRATTVAMVLSVAVHALAFALLHLRAPPALQDEAGAAAAESDAYLRSRPLRALDIRAVSPGLDGRSPGATAATQSHPAEIEAPARVAVEAAPPALHLTRAEPRPAAHVLAAAGARAPGETATLRANYDVGVDFAPASRAAREAVGGSDRTEDRRLGGRPGGGIGVFVGGGCEAPAATGLGGGIGVGRFAPSY